VSRALREIPAFAWLLAALPALRIFGGNTERLGAEWLLLCLAVTFAIYFLGRGAFRAVIQNREVAEIEWAIAYVCVMAAGFFFPAKGNELLWVASCSFAAAAVAFAPWTRRAASVGLIVFAGLACAVPLLAMANSPVWLERGSIRQIAAAAFGELPRPAAGSVADRRDIYYLIFDRYARADQLKAVYGFDNTPFISELERRGLVVAERSFANYQRTTHSLISSLNLDYLTRLEREPARSSGDWLPLYEMLQDFRLRRFLDAQGYAFHFFGSWWEPTRVNRFADQNHNWLAFPEALRAMLDQSLLPYLAKVAGVDIFDHRLVQCQRSKHAFAELDKLAATEAAPRFVFAHFLVPHPPFVIDEKGRCISAEEARSHTRAENYTRQIVYTNREILKFLDIAMARPGRKPIIIIQSDEGPWPERFAGDEIAGLGADVTAADWREATPAELGEKMAILNALYLPDRDMSDIAESASPVNSFRRVLRDYFHVPLAILPDRQMIFESAQRLYRFHDVTELLAGEASSHPGAEKTVLRPRVD
jgi:hypothetical protein